MALEVSLLKLNELSKGSRIPARVIEQATRTNRNHRDYGLAVLAVRTAVENHFREAHRQVVTTAEERGDVRVLTDAEASEYQEDQFEAGIRRMQRANHKARGVDVSTLNHVEREEHDRRLVVQAAYLAGIRATRKVLRQPLEYARDRP